MTSRYVRLPMAALLVDLGVPKQRLNIGTVRWNNESLTALLDVGYEDHDFLDDDFLNIFRPHCHYYRKNPFWDKDEDEDDAILDGEGLVDMNKLRRIYTDDGSECTFDGMTFSMDYAICKADTALADTLWGVEVLPESIRPLQCLSMEVCGLLPPALELLCGMELRVRVRVSCTPFPVRRVEWCSGALQNALYRPRGTAVAKMAWLGQASDLTTDAVTHELRTRVAAMRPAAAPGGAGADTAILRLTVAVKDGETLQLEAADMAAVAAKMPGVHVHFHAKQSASASGFEGPQSTEVHLQAYDVGDDINYDERVFKRALCATLLMSGGSQLLVQLLLREEARESLPAYVRIFRHMWSPDNMELIADIILDIDSDDEGVLIALMELHRSPLYSTALLNKLAARIKRIGESMLRRWTVRLDYLPPSKALLELIKHYDPQIRRWYKLLKGDRASEDKPEFVGDVMCLFEKTKKTHKRKVEAAYDDETTALALAEEAAKTRWQVKAWRNAAVFCQML